MCGGQGTSTYAYFVSPFADGANTWKIQTVETLPNGPAVSWNGPTKLHQDPGIPGCPPAPAQSTPLVDGTPVPRGSISTACRSARAAALKVPSTMWCVFRP